MITLRSLLIVKILSLLLPHLAAISPILEREYQISNKRNEISNIWKQSFQFIIVVMT